MQRLPSVDPATATGKAQELLAAVRGKLGVVPNMMRVLANAPAALDAYLAFGGALGAGALDVRVREQIALAVGEANLCTYCLSAHTFLGAKAGLAPAEMDAARRAQSGARRTAAILTLARAIVVQRGELADADLRAARDAGLSDGEIIETIANVALNIFTNYVNHAAHTVVDFPPAPAGAGAGEAGARPAR